MLLTKDEQKEVAIDIRRIADSLEKLSDCIDPKRKAFRMVDVDRAKVYGKHLGKKLRK